MYSIEDVALITGLSTRTVRSHLADGFLSGDKSSGAWQFSEEEIDAYIRHPSVAPGIKAKRNALVYDFLGGRPGEESRVCVIWDQPGPAGRSAVTAICRRICELEPGSSLRFASEELGRGTRLILTGGSEDVRALLAGLPEER